MSPYIQFSAATRSPIEVDLWEGSGGPMAVIKIGEVRIAGDRREVDEFVCELLAAWTAAAGDAIQALLDADDRGGEG